MKWSNAQAIGESGENLVATVVNHELGWPYRKMELDLGIDGEIEILDEIGETTGTLIKVQIKTEESDDFTGKKSVSGIEKQNVYYWKKLALPVILCQAFLESKRIYWVPIDFRITVPNSKYATMTIDFENSSLLNSSARKDLIQFASSREPYNPIESLIDHVVYEVTTLREYYGNPMHWNMNSQEYYQRRHRVWELLRTIKNTLLELPWINHVSRYPQIEEEAKNIIYYFDRELRKMY